MGASFDQECRAVNDEWCARRKCRCDGLLACGGDAWVEDGTESGARLGVAEDDGAERGAVEVAIGEAKSGAEGSDDLFEAFGTRRNDLTSELVSVNDSGAAFSQNPLHLALAAGDAAGESDDAGRGAVVGRREAQLTPI